MAALTVPAAKKGASAPAPRKAARTTDLSKFKLEVQGTPEPAYIYGVVERIEQGFKIAIKRRQSQKIDTAIIEPENALAVCLGENGYILTDHPNYCTRQVDFLLKDATVTDDEITGFDEKGNQIIIQRGIDITTRWSAPAD